MSECGSRECAAHGITTILFDLDNTLITTREADVAACEKVASWLENQGMTTEKSWAITKKYLQKFLEAPAPDYPTDQEGLDTWRRNLWKFALPANYQHLGTSVAQWEKVRETGCQKYCSSIVISQDHNVEKPDKALFDVACTQLQVKPRECIMVGDKIETDIKGGKNAGIKITVWLNTRDKIAPNNTQPDFTIQNILDLPTVFRRLPLVLEG
ncbi:N-acylneuraminate-9-phosphatase [Chionoecetes opilio]|uniref:N-acylneuraminate-9-phosphatase n=1 Tax=Chionoecetes opilio TaxID=41210 RepID=A0A8J4YUB2_CHIOP|nr:N-acylneuraminate-9-phosphatase [Chionoecetes opilio]